MQYVPPPPKPPFNDQLMQALNPVREMLTARQQQMLKGIKAKYESNGSGDLSGVSGGIHRPDLPPR